MILLHRRSDLSVLPLIVQDQISDWKDRKSLWKKKTWKIKIDPESKKIEVGVSLMADVSDCLDKCKVYKIEELNEAIDGFDERWVIQGSLFNGYIDGNCYSFKKMKWNACEEIKILQKVHHFIFVLLHFAQDCYNFSGIFK
ncbi:hypothetical protein L1987_48144 [Smallanthus sonchifolius]|uniref:Uncharacterized protein n=1 Tax=Smallanthus sonchifolius TaxID=185202 RepID=A0ACB9FR53_9ASTR|nr:hypothetical protein L1987_48144 [Smallanthus sonchifolius]